MTATAPLSSKCPLRSNDRRSESDRRGMEGGSVSPSENKRSDSERRSGADQRRSERLNCRVHGSLFINGAPVEGCVIKDISETGMQIFIRSGLWLPHKFEVVLSPGEKPITVIKKWSSRDLVGVQTVTESG